MSFDMREQFEKLPEIANKIDNNICYDDEVNRYYFKGIYVNEFYHCLLAWLNGAWYAYQEQQKKIDFLIADKDQLLEDIENMSGYTP